MKNKKLTEKNSTNSDEGDDWNEICSDYQDDSERTNVSNSDETMLCEIATAMLSMSVSAAKEGICVR